MKTCSFKFTVLFEEPFWIGIYEREADGKYEVCKITFGAEPKIYEVNEFLLKNWNKLKFSPSIKCEMAEEKYVNPKRLQRLIKKQAEFNGVGTKAQQALKLQQEQGKLERKEKRRKRLEEEEERRFLLHIKKKKEKHRGH